ncbi:MAG: tripartite tricarboxylate transporter substrate binding protein [Limnohabitans sp.]|nr:tripartite tricarboxylate transporter substrate binding protein [Limnohabitans sp.]
MLKRNFFFAATLAFALTGSVFAQNKDFPTKPFRIFVPFTAGSGSDTSARFFGERLAKQFGQTALVENKPGASGIIAVQALLALPADGHAILLASNSPISVNPISIKNLPYNPMTDLAPLAGLSRNMNVWVVNGNSKFNNLKDVVEHSKNNPSKPLSLANYSAGYRLAGEWFTSMTNVKFNHISYKGGAQIFTDLMGDQLDIGIADLGGAAALIKSGKLKALAVSGEKRHLDFPNVPNFIDSGFPEYVNYAWTSFYVKAGTPEAIKKRLIDALVKIRDSKEGVDFIKASGADSMPFFGDSMQKFQQDELERFSRIAKSAGIQAE